MSLLSSSVPSAASQLVARRLNCCAWRRSLTTSPLLSVRRTRARAIRSGPAADHDIINFPKAFMDNAKGEIAVIGGGLTGLTTAYYLAKKLPATTQITIHEASDRLGGWIRTERHPVNLGSKRGTVVFERGPRSLTSLAGNYWRYDDLVLYDLCLDLSLRLSVPPLLPRYIYYPDHLVPLPPHATLLEMFRETLFTQTIPAGLVYWYNKRVKTHDPSKIPPDISISDWLYELTNSRLAVGTLASAMVHGIYGGDISKLSARSVFDRYFWGWNLPEGDPGTHLMPEAEKEILESLGQDKYIQKLALQPKGALIDFGAAGMQCLPDAMAAALKDQSNVTIKLNSPITSIQQNPENQKLEITSGRNESPASYHKIISTMTAQNLAAITDGNLPSLAKCEAVDIMTANLWFPEERLKPPGTGYLIPGTVWPEVNPEHVLGVFFDSDVQVPGPDEPTGTKLFVLMGGHHYNKPGVSPPSEEEAIKQARRVLERHLGIPRDEPCYAVAGLAKQSIPQHYVGHHDLMCDAHEELIASYGGRLSVAGGSFNRIGTVAALRSGYDIAHKMTQDNWLDVTGLDEIADNPFAFIYQAQKEILVR